MRLSTVVSMALPALAFRVNQNTAVKRGCVLESECSDLFPGGDDWLLALQQNVAPGILALPSITCWDHPDCVSCWSVTWEEGDQTRMLLAIDRSEEGFITSHGRMNSLANGQADGFNSLEPLEVIARRVSLDNCVFPPQSIRKEKSDEL
ncbi:hypothetical protein LZ30DRAFT_691622 [Colletotrichum cereale]|nr:hypothetical protein LZ30DRAFT_691622 [Colletotrichum cereale]